ncbi:MAG: protein TolA [Hydrogenophilales bacterium 17-61-9]|nr:MAG: protein TolA [Hydrogenophilales bacterium 16-62-9]OZA31157.1 MAG: protein TolA [Hydrogenophilales bacterium 17-61-9]
MNSPIDAPHIARPGSSLAAGAMALGVHVLFLLLLVFGVSWQTRHPAPVMVDIWDALPPSPPPRPQPKIVSPEPVKAPVPKIEPAPMVKEAPPKAPDIALEKKKADAERMQKLKALHEAEQKARADAARVEAEAVRKAHEKQLAEQKKRELLRQMEEEDLVRRMADETAANEARQARLAEARAAAGKRQAEVARVVGQHRDLIRAKVHSNTRLPDNLPGNPEVRFLVKLLPTGEVVSVRLTRSSGNAAYDAAVERAIEKSSPLPLPAERDARAEFVPELSFVHRPKE